MQLGWRIFSKSSARKAPLDTVPLKKIVAVSDEYWQALYAPIIDVAVRCFSVFDGRIKHLETDYVDQFVRIIRRSKGGVQDDPLCVHLHTYSIVLSFSAIYLSRLCSDFEFHAISTSKKTSGDRSVFYPWLEVPGSSTIKVKKAGRVYPGYIIGFSILNSVCSSVGWNWLHSNQVILKGLLDAVYTNGENGSLSGYLADVRKPMISHAGIGPASHVAPSSKSHAERAHAVDNQSQHRSSAASPEDALDALISGLGSGGPDVSLDDLLSGTQQQSSEKSLQQTEPVVIADAGSELASGPTDSIEPALDFSVFDNEPVSDAFHPSGEPGEASDFVPADNEKAKPREITEPASDTVSSLDEFQAFLATAEAAPGPDSHEERPSEHEASISGDLLDWAIKRIKAGADFSDLGACVLKLSDGYFVALSPKQGVENFVRDDYELDDDSMLPAIADEVRTDLMLSDLWLPDPKGGDVWYLDISGSMNEVVLLKSKPGDEGLSSHAIASFELKERS